MKKLILIMLVAFGMIATAKAQAVYTMPTVINGTKLVDTTDNTETNYLYYRTTQVAHGSIQIVVTKLGGTPNGCFTLEWSNDGTNYVAASAADTIHVSNTAGAVTSFFVRTPAQAWPYQYVRIKSVGRGTASYKFQAYLKPFSY